MRQALTLVAIGLAVGLLVAVGISRLVATLLYGVTATDPVTFIGVSLLLIVVGFAASLFPAFRASRMDPVATLR